MHAFVTDKFSRPPFNPERLRQAPDDLIFRKDDIIVIDEEMNVSLSNFPPSPSHRRLSSPPALAVRDGTQNEWFKGHLSTDRGPNPRVGLFPSNYVTKMCVSRSLPPIPRRPGRPDRPPLSSPISFLDSPPSNSNNNSYQSPNEPRINHSSAQYFNNNPPLNGPSHSPSPYYDDKSQSQYNNQPPYQQQQQQNQMQPYQPPPQQVQVAPPPAPEKKPGNGFGKLLATSAVGGVGFGAGSAVGSGIIHAIF